MKTIIAGSRTIKDKKILEEAIAASGFEITRVITGMAKGVDSLGKIWGNENAIPVSEYPANWGKYGKRAGYLRNLDMAKQANALIAVWDGESKGTAHMINIAKKQGLKIYVHKVEVVKIKTPAEMAAELAKKK